MFYMYFYSSISVFFYDHGKTLAMIIAICYIIRADTYDQSGILQNTGLRCIGKKYIFTTTDNGDMCMNKKLLLTVTALVCVLTCAFGFVACGDNDDADKVSCTLTPTAHVRQVQINIPREDVALIDLGTIFDRWSAFKQVVKNKKYDIDVVLDASYEIGTLKMFINGTEMTLTPMINSDTGETVPGSYTCKYTPTADFTITFSGEAKKSTTTLTFNAIDWQPCYDYYSGQENAAIKGDALKAEIQNNVRMKLLINDAEKAPFNGITLGAFENTLSANSVVTVNLTDKVEIRLYTESNELELSDMVINLIYQDFGQGGERILSSDKKEFSIIVESVQNYAATITVSTYIYPTESNR